MTGGWQMRVMVVVSIGALWGVTLAKGADDINAWKGLAASMTLFALWAVVMHLASEQAMEGWTQAARDLRACHEANMEEALKHVWGDGNSYRGKGN